MVRNKKSKFFSHCHLIEFYEINRMSHVPHFYDIVILSKQPLKYLTVMTSSAMVFAGSGMVKEARRNFNLPVFRHAVPQHIRSPANFHFPFSLV